MILEATLAMIMTVGSRPVTQEQGWVRRSVPATTALRRELTDAHILAPGLFATETDISFIQGANIAISRLDWVDAQIESYGSLEEGWDGPDSQPPQQAHIEAARSILRSLPAGTPIPKPMLSSSGDLGLYWEDPEWMADIAIDGDHEFSLFFRSRDRRVEVLKSGIVLNSSSGALIKDTLAAV